MRLCMGQLEQNVAAARHTDPDDGSAIEGFDHGAHVACMLSKRVRRLERIRGARTAWIDRYDPELLAEPLDNRLKCGGVIAERSHKEQRPRTAPMLVERDPCPIAEHGSIAMPLVLDRVSGVPGAWQR